MSRLDWARLSHHRCLSLCFHLSNLSKQSIWYLTLHWTTTYHPSHPQIIEDKRTNSLFWYEHASFWNQFNKIPDLIHFNSFLPINLWKRVICITKLFLHRLIFQIQDHSINQYKLIYELCTSQKSDSNIVWYWTQKKQIFIFFAVFQVAIEPILTDTDFNRFEHFNLTDTHTDLGNGITYRYWYQCLIRKKYIPLPIPNLSGPF